MRDRSVPGSRRIDLELPGGRLLRLSEGRHGWAATDDPVAGDPLWPRLGDAIEALTGRRRGDETWIALLEEHATPLASPPAAPLPAEEQARLDDLPRRRPGAYVDGPRAHDGGGWYVFVGGLPGGAWVMEYADTPAEAAHAALARAGALLDPSA